MFKDIIPNLVSFDTDLKHLSGCYLSTNFDFYGEIKNKNRFHYKIIINNDFEIPRIYDFRSAYYYKKDKFWYYQRNIYSLILKFGFDSKNKIFYVNKLYTFIPFTMGGVFPPGNLITDLISLELFLNGITIIKGCSFKINDKIVIILAPSFNGKTQLINSVLKKGGQYIAEDIIAYDFIQKKLYPTAFSYSLFSHIGRVKHDRTNRKKDYLRESQTNPEIFFVQNITNNRYKSRKKNLLEIFNFQSLIWMRNPLGQAYIFEEKLTELIYKQILKLSTFKSQIKFKQINNFDYDSVFNY